MHMHTYAYKHMHTHINMHTIPLIYKTASDQRFYNWTLQRERERESSNAASVSLSCSLLLTLSDTHSRAHTHMQRGDTSSLSQRPDWAKSDGSTAEDLIGSCCRVPARSFDQLDHHPLQVHTHTHSNTHTHTHT